MVRIEFLINCVGLKNATIALSSVGFIPDVDIMKYYIVHHISLTIRYYIVSIFVVVVTCDDAAYCSMTLHFHSIPVLLASYFDLKKGDLRFVN